VQRTIHFAGALGIDGLGPGTVAALVKGGVLACPADVLRLPKYRPALRGCVAGWLWLF
jgi:NAD-dependent DNA ligase